MKNSKIVKVENIREIIDIKFLQNMQDFFAKTMNVASLIVDDYGPVTEPSNFTDFCSNCVRSTNIGSERCNQCDIKWGKLAAQNGRPMVYTCHAGLKDFVIPIMVEGQHIASILGGQVLTEPPDEKVFIKIAKEIGINEEKCLTAVKKIDVVTNEKIEGAIDFLYNVVNSISAVFYANLKLKKYGMGYKPSRSITLEDWFLTNQSKLPMPLTEREFQVLKLIVLGKSNNEIAKELFISVHTVKAHVSSILEKFFVEDRVQIAVKAIRDGLV